MNHLTEKEANALVIMLGANIKHPDINFEVVPLETGNGCFVGTRKGKIRVFKGDDMNKYKLHIGGTVLQPRVVIKGNTYDGICKLFDSIEEINE